MVKPKPILRTRTVSTRVTEEEFARFEARACGSGVNLGKWVREELLERLKPEEVVGNEILLAEMMALRTIVINLPVAQAQGQPISQEKIQELVDFSDRERFRRAQVDSEKDGSEGRFTSPHGTFQNPGLVQAAFDTRSLLPFHGKFQTLLDLTKRFRFIFAQFDL